MREAKRKEDTDRQRIITCIIVIHVKARITCTKLKKIILLVTNTCNTHVHVSVTA